MRALSDKEVISEIEDHFSENELSSDEEEDQLSHLQTSLTPTLFSRDGKIVWKSEPQASCGNHKYENPVKMIPGPTRYAASRIRYECSSFMLFITPVTINIILKKSNIEWKEIEDLIRDLLREDLIRDLRITK